MADVEMELLRDDDEEEVAVPMMVEEGAAAAGLPANLLPRDAEAVHRIRQSWRAEGATLDNVRAAVEANPEALMTMDNNGLMPIHWAVRDIVDEDILEYLVESRPESVRVRTDDSKQYFPIHEACALTVDLLDSYMDRLAANVRILLEAFPEAVQEIARGRYPLEVSSWNQRAYPINRCIIEAWPGAIDAAYENGTFLLHNAVEMPGWSEETAFEWVQFLVLQQPNLIHRVDERGNEAFFSISSETPPDVVLYLLDLWWKDFRRHISPGEMLDTLVGAWDWDDHEDMLHVLRVLCRLCLRSGGIRSSEGDTILAIAAQRCAPLVVIRTLVQEWRPSVRIRDVDGMLPIHRLLERYRWTRPDLTPIAHFLIQEFPESLFEATSEGDTPLQLLLKAMHLEPDHVRVKTALIELFVSAAPYSVRVADSNGNSPLQTAVCRRLPVENLRPLVNAWPDSCRHEGRDGMTAIQDAVTGEQTSPSVVRFLVRRCPDSLQSVTPNGSTLLHLALAHGEPNMESVSFLVARDPRLLLRTTNDRRMKPAHVAAAHNSSPQALQYLIEQQLQRWTDVLGPHSPILGQSLDGSTPVHLALARPEPSMTLLRYSVDQDPGSLEYADTRGMRPVHIAAAHNVSPEALQYLIEQEQLRWADVGIRGRPTMHRCADGSTPVHLALAQPNPPLDLLRCLVEQDTGSLALADNRGMVPVHVSAAHNESPEALQYLIEHGPHSLSLPDRLGALALHAALTREDPSPDIVRVLVQARPESMSSPDNSGSLPLHLLLASRLATWEGVQCLYPHQAPDRTCMLHRNRRGYMPFHVAATNNVPLDVLFFLVRGHPELIHEF